MGMHCACAIKIGHVFVIVIIINVTIAANIANCVFYGKDLGFFPWFDRI